MKITNEDIGFGIGLVKMSELPKDDELIE